MFSLPEVDRKFEQKSFQKKTHQIAPSIPGWIDAASTIPCFHVPITIFSLPEMRSNFQENFWQKKTRQMAVSIAGILGLVCVIPCCLQLNLRTRNPNEKIFITHSNVKSPVRVVFI